MDKECIGSIDFLDGIETEATEQSARILSEAKEAVACKMKNADLEIAKWEKIYQKKKDDAISQMQQNTQNNINMEKRKLDLSIREQVISESISQALEKAKEIANDKSYADIIRNLIVEAVFGIGKSDLNLIISPWEKKWVTDSFLKEIETNLSAKIGVTISIRLSPSESSKQGIVLEDREGRVVYDNRFETRLIRYQSQIRKILCEEIGKEYNDECN